MSTVLLVEDNALNRKMLERRLRHYGHKVLVATEGNQGVALAIEHQPDVIIMDTDLPVIDGWQAIKILKASAATMDIPVLALTPKTKSGNWKTALEVDCNDYDTKPIVLKRLMGKVETLLGGTAPAATQTKAPQVALADSLTSALATPQSRSAPLSPSQISHQIPTIRPSASGLLNNRYEIIQVLNNSPFGQCILAKDLTVTPATTVIINTLKLSVNDPALLSLVRSSLVSEMSFLAVISRHDDIATCLDYFEQDDIFYWVQAHVIGTSLTQELGSAQSMGFVLKLTRSLLSTVHPFHQGQMVHCECHPDSFVRRQSDGRIVLVEYGLLKRMFVSLRSHSLTYRQALLKQGQYQPAEQRAGNPQFNSDIYSIGMIVLQSLTGQTPEWLMGVSGQSSLTNLVKADAQVVKLFERMVSPNPQLRFESASDALAALPLGLIPKESTYQQVLSS